LAIILLKTEKERLFYPKLTSENNIGVRELRKQISKKVFEKSENANIQLYGSKTIEKDFFKDPFF